MSTESNQDKSNSVKPAVTKSVATAEKNEVVKKTPVTTSTAASAKPKTARTAPKKTAQRRQKRVAEEVSLFCSRRVWPD